ncbi:M23 family metallopeptidase [Corynebacterium uropygiale]|uniref:M23 family metallopeptidase n=1 Tax=Corynebacterium uropygiale TaxID=1775911 RepID=A0A9X1QN69_9CORY|nr:M23 family metallopeptidase [Corynebacterium uropygiale]MCF4006384.1 M23 family metallopeptidase [Corynebacterium uropygiale]
MNSRILRLVISALCCIGLSTAALPTAAAYVDPTTGRPSARKVLRPFDKPAQNWLPGHRGVDLDAPIGSDILAAEDGAVAFVGVVAGTPTLSIDHADGIRTTYQPVHAVVERGAQVKEGQLIGRLGHPFDGYPGLHWGAKRGEDYLNPLSLLDAPVIRLKPVGGRGGRPL